MQTAFAQEAIKKHFEYVATKPIVTGAITIVADYNALMAEYDRIQMADNVIYSGTGQPWAPGDGADEDARAGAITNGFANSGRIWINANQGDPTVLVHEMLHVNTASGFPALVGRAVNEGITQRFAVQVVIATGNSVAGSGSTYVEEQDVVNALVDVVGEDTIRHAYLRKAQMLVTAYEAVMGKRSWAILERTLDDTPAGYAAAKAILQPPSVAQKIAAINTLLDYWISDNDLTIIESLVSTVSGADKRAIAYAVAPRTNEMNSRRQRARLRAILGST